MDTQLDFHKAAMLLFAGININNVCDRKIGFLMARMLKGRINLSKLGVLRDKKMSVIGIYYGETSQRYYASQAKAGIGKTLSDEGYIVDIPIIGMDGNPVRLSNRNLLTVANGEGFITFVKDETDYVYARLINIPKDEVDDSSILDAFEAWAGGRIDQPEQTAQTLH